MLTKQNEMQHNSGDFITNLDTFDQMLGFCKRLATTGFVPNEARGKPDEVLARLQYGHEIKLKPMQALKSIAVINGRPCVWGDALLGLIQSHPDFEDIIEVQGENMAACTIKRRGKTECTRTFSVEDAKRAGLYGRKGPWSTYPKRMLQMRARAFALRDSFADVLMGVETAEEVRDYPQEKIVNIASDVNANVSRVEFIKNKLEQEEANATMLESYEDGADPQENYQEKLIGYVQEFNIPEEIYNPWLLKANVHLLSELDNEQAKKCVEFIELKYCGSRTTDGARANEV